MWQNRWRHIFNKQNQEPPPKSDSVGKLRGLVDPDFDPHMSRRMQCISIPEHLHNLFFYFYRKRDKSIMEENDWNQRSMSRTSVKWTSRSGGDKTHMLCFSSFYRSVYKYRCLDLSIQPLLFLIVVSRAPANWIMEADWYQANNCNQVPPSDHISVPLGWTWHVQ